MTKSAFQPAPRPRSRTSPEDMERLTEATKDMGFARPTTAPDARQGQEGKTPLAPVRAPLAPVEQASLKFPLPKSLMRELKQVALDRDVTIRYLVLEALAAKGYAIDMASIPEDGRKLR